MNDSVYDLHIDKKDYERLKAFIEKTCGIKMPEAKVQMVEARLKKRLRDMKMKSFSQYLDFVFNERGHNELLNMIDSLTTNTTSFFRESTHFNILISQILPDYISGLMPCALRFWSAGCSTGEEPYTIAMVMLDYITRRHGVRFSIEATDLSTRVLKKARLAIYADDKVEGLNYELKRKFFLRSKDREQAEIRVKPEVRQLVRFRRLNFMDANYFFEETFDFIFFRNVMIYFDRITQESILTKMLMQLRPGGFLFIGHSETLNAMNLPIEQFAPTVYRKI